MMTQLKSVQIQDCSEYNTLYLKKSYPENQLFKVPLQQNFLQKVIQFTDKEIKGNCPNKSQLYILIYRTQLNLSDNINIKQLHPPKAKLKYKQKFNQLFCFSIFQNLRQLIIKKTYLDSCQFLAFLHAPALKSLIITDNLFTSFKPLIKMNTISINQIDIRGNPGSVFDFHRLKFPQILDRIQFQSSTCIEVKSQDLSGFVKLQPQLIDFFKLNKNRTIQKHVIQQFQLRFVKNHRKVQIYFMNGIAYV